MTMLPLDYNQRPWKDKYIDEETPVMNRWIIFGEHQDGTVDVMSPIDGQDIMINIPKEAAEEVIEARNRFVDVVLKHFGYQTPNAE